MDILVGKNLNGTIIDNENYRNMNDPPELTNMKLIEKMLADYDIDYNILGPLLKETGSLIAGGSILGAITGEKINDLDIYIPINNLKSFVDTFNLSFGNKYTNHRCIESSKYCRSFLRRNGIKIIYTFVINKKKKGEIIDKHILIDLMSVRTKKTPLEVVNNFDLTFCQTWYDGTHVYASHPEHIKNRSGYLQGDYVPVYISGNRFLKNRIEKYTKLKRINYTVKLDTSAIESFEVDRNTTNTFCGKNEINFDQWFISTLMKFILSKRYNPLQYKRFNKSNIQGDYEDSIIYIEHYDEYDSDNETLESEGILKLTEKSYLKNSTLDTNTKFAHAKHDFLYKIKKLMLDSNYIRRFMQKYFDFTMEAVKRQGVCFVLSTEETVWDFHLHTLDQGISQEGFEAYLTSIMSDPDKKNIRCYAPGCTETLKEHEIRSLISDEFWEKISLPADISRKLNTSAMDMILTNTKTTSVDQVTGRQNGWGDVYHHTLCPYCVAQEVREVGCAYMTHEVNNSLNKPYCLKHNVIKEIQDMYRVCSGGLEFCVTCGRPCCRHQHFNLDLENPQLIETVLNAGEDQYTKCMGGGRPELFARLLAIQKVISEQDFDDDFEQRKACAFAALKAPLDAELMEKAQAIFDKDPESRVLANLGINPLTEEQLANIEFENQNGGRINIQKNIGLILPRNNQNQGPNISQNLNTSQNINQNQNVNYQNYQNYLNYLHSQNNAENEDENENENENNAENENYSNNNDKKVYNQYGGKKPVSLNDLKQLSKINRKTRKSKRLHRA